MSFQSEAKNVNIRLNIIIKKLEAVIARLKEINIEKNTLESKQKKVNIPEIFVAKKIALLDIELNSLQKKVNYAKSEVAILTMLRDLQIDVNNCIINENTFRPII